MSTVPSGTGDFHSSNSRMLPGHQARLQKSKKDTAPATERDPKFFLRVFSATLALADCVRDLAGYKQG